MKTTPLLIGVLGALGPAVGNASNDDPAKPYCAAEIYSNIAVKYGRIEMRMRAAKGSGTLSTFFTYKDGSEKPEVTWEEIDIEIFGKHDARTWQSNVLTGLPRTGDEAEHAPGGSFADGFHVFALEWTPDSVAWFLDGKEVRRIVGGKTTELVSPQTLRFNLWPTNIVSWAGPFDERLLPIYQYVDWVKFSRYEDGRFVHEWTDDFDTFDQTRWSKADWTFDVNMADFAPQNVTTRDGYLILGLTHADESGRFDGASPTDEDRQP